MDIITHTLSGVAISTMWAALVQKSLWKKGVILCCGAIGAALPDIDAISLWSRFDQTVGAVFHLPHMGKDIYFSNYWYSHHNFFHSLVSGVLFTGGFGLFLFAWRRFRRIQNTGRRTGFIQHQAYVLAVFCGYIAHLCGDLPTPGHTWRGIKLLWPWSHSIGGTGQIWWWNNYDIFLLLVGCCLLNMVVIILVQWRRTTFVTYLPALLCVVTCVAILFQIYHRPVSFAYTGYTTRYDEYERTSLTIQHTILGKSLYPVMVEFDQLLGVAF